jgi:hypothetical protein
VDQIKGNRRTFDAMLLALIEDCIHASGEFMQDGRGLLIFNQSSVLKGRYLILSPRSMLEVDSPRQ